MPKNGQEASAQNSGIELGPHSRVLRFSDMPVQKRGNGAEGRNLCAGALVTGEQVAIHESMQPAGAVPNPAHTIHHTELICLRKGTLDFTHDGITERANAGDILLVAIGTNHAVRNAGPGPASYFVVALGGDTNR